MTETIDARIARIQSRLARRREVYDSEITWLCEQLVRARQAIRDSLENYDDVSARVYLDEEA